MKSYIPAPPWDAFLPKASAQCWGFDQPQEREVKEACGGPGAWGGSPLPIQAHGLRSVHSPGPASVCAAIQGMGVNPGGTSSPGRQGPDRQTWLGDGEKVLNEGWLQGTGSHFLTLVQFGPLHGLRGPDSCLDGPWRGRPGPQLPIHAKVFWRDSPCKAGKGPARDLP